MTMNLDYNLIPSLLKVKIAILLTLSGKWIVLKRCTGIDYESGWATATPPYIPVVQTQIDFHRRVETDS